MSNGWIAVDLDGTLAEYNGWVHELTIGKPIPTMVERVKLWLAEGKQVRIFTARVSLAEGNRARATPNAIRIAIEEWCRVHIGSILPITNEKDFGMIELWDDRCVQVVPNTGQRADGKSETTDDAHTRQIDTMRNALNLILDAADYTAGNCRVNEMVGAVLPKEIIAKVRAAAR